MRYSLCLRCLATAQLPDNLIFKILGRPHLALLPGSSLTLLTHGCVRDPCSGFPQPLSIPLSQYRA